MEDEHLIHPLLTISEQILNESPFPFTDTSTFDLYISTGWCRRLHAVQFLSQQGGGLQAPSLWTPRDQTGMYIDPQIVSNWVRQKRIFRSASCCGPSLFQLILGHVHRFSFSSIFGRLRKVQSSWNSWHSSTRGPCTTTSPSSSLTHFRSRILSHTVLGM